MIIEAVLLVVCICIVFSRLSRSLKGPYPPGPTGVPLLGYLPFLGNDPHFQFAEFRKKYGNIFSITFGMEKVIILNGHQAIREALKSDVFAGRPMTKFNVMRHGGYNRGIIFSEGQVWVEQRRFTIRHLRDFGFRKQSMEEMIMIEVTDWIAEMRKNIHEPIDIGVSLHLSVLNALWSMVTGTRFKLDDPALRQLFVDVVECFDSLDSFFGMAFFVPFLAQWTSTWKQTETLFANIRALITKEMKEHKRTYSEDNMRDLIDVYLRQLKEEKDPNSSFFGEEGEQNAITDMTDLFAAGADTTANVLGFVFLYMIRFPHIQKTIQEEIDQVVGNRLPSTNDRAQLPYTEAVILECFRFSCLAPLTPAHTLTADTVFSGFHLPKGTQVIANLHSVMTDSDHWTDPENFRPERFLESSQQVKREDALLVFSYGKRVCLGEKLAQDEIFLFFTCVLQQFNLRIPPGHPEPTMEPSEGGIVKHPKPFKILFEERY